MANQSEVYAPESTPAEMRLSVLTQNEAPLRIAEIAVATSVMAGEAISQG